MKGKDIVKGEFYRMSESMRGTYYEKVEVTGFRNIEKWDRKLMKYHSIPGEVEVKRQDGRTNIVRFQAIIELWSEFAEREPEKVKRYDYQYEHGQWSNNRRNVLIEYADKLEEGRITGRPYPGYGWGSGTSMTVSMTIPEYLRYVGVTPEEFANDIGEEPVDPTKTS